MISPKVCIVSAMVVLLLAICTLAAYNSNIPAPAENTQNPVTPAGVPAETKLDYPKGDITLIIPYAAGGEGDNAFRCIETALKVALGVTVVPDFQSGGNAIPGSQSVLNAKADGYTIGLLAAGPLAIQPYMGTAQFTTSDFQPISNLTAGQVMFAINDSLPYADFDAWLTNAKENPGKFKVAVGSVGGTPHLGLVKEIGRAHV